MKKKILLPVTLIAIATLIVAVAKKPFNDNRSENQLKFERWENLSEPLLVSALKNDEGEKIKSITLSKADVLELLTEGSPKVYFSMAIDENGSLSFTLNSEISARNPSFISEKETLEKALESFDQNDYRSSHDKINFNAMKHLIDLQPAIAEIQKWEDASDSDVIAGFTATTGDRIKALAYNREVFENLLAQGNLAFVTSFLGLTENGQVSLVSVGVDSNGTLMLPNSKNSNSNNYSIFNFVLPCPPDCLPECGTGDPCFGGKVCKNGVCIDPHADFE